MYKMYKIFHNGIHFGEAGSALFLEMELMHPGWVHDNGVWTLKVGDTVLHASINEVPEEKSFSELPRAPRT
jgi:hypothetical protein